MKKRCANACMSLHERCVGSLELNLLFTIVDGQSASMTMRYTDKYCSWNHRKLVLVSSAVITYPFSVLRGRLSLTPRGRQGLMTAFGKIWLGVNQLWTGGRVSAVWLALVLSGPASAPHCRRCLLLWLLVARGELCWLAFLVLWVFGSFPVHGMFQPGYGWGDVANPGLLG